MPKQKPQLLDENSLVAIKDYVENKQVVIDDITNIPVYSLSNDGQFLTISFTPGYVLTYFEMALKTDHDNSYFYVECSFNPQTREYDFEDSEFCGVNAYYQASKDLGTIVNTFVIEVTGAAFSNLNLEDLDLIAANFLKVSGTFEFDF